LTQSGHSVIAPDLFRSAGLSGYDAWSLASGQVMRRRYFIKAITGSAIAWPLAVRGQQREIPVIGYLSSRSPSDSADIVAAFRQGLKDSGFVDGQNVTIASSFAAGNFDRLPELASDLVRRQVTVMVATGGTVSVVKAKPVVPRTIPIVFAMGGDPVKLGVVASLNRPGDNVTGVAFLVNGLATKQIELLHHLLPNVTVVGFLVNPKDPNAAPDAKDAREAAKTFGQKLVLGEASTEDELRPAISTFVQGKAAGLFVDAEPFLLDKHKEIIELARQYRLPVVSQFRSFAADGGLASYGTSLTEANRLLGVYTGRVLSGTSPADLPVVQSTKFDLVLNLKTAKALDLTIPPSLLAIADEVIE
jgi:putative ABC transport system substrate-binding protein